jgi:hypothetical protein
VGPDSGEPAAPALVIDVPPLPVVDPAPERPSSSPFAGAAHANERSNAAQAARSNVNDVRSPSSFGARAPPMTRAMQSDEGERHEARDVQGSYLGVVQVSGGMSGTVNEGKSAKNKDNACLSGNG